jgi:uncharacterized protein (DUF4415 family)
MTDSESLTRAVLTTDGRVLVAQPDGSYRPAAGRTDWQRVARATEAELGAAIATDPDDPGNDPAFWEHVRPVHPVGKERVTMRLDTDLLAWFRRHGRGYQTMINAVLRGYYEARKGQPEEPRPDR